jgi:hypothetical protein
MDARLFEVVAKFDLRELLGLDERRAKVVGCLAVQGPTWFTRPAGLATQ